MQTTSTKLNLFPWSTISRFVISYSCISVSVCLKKAEDLLEGAMQRMSVLQAVSGATVAGARGWQKYWLMGLPAMSIMQQETGFTLEYSCCHRSLCTYIKKTRSNFLAAKDASRPGLLLAAGLSHKTPQKKAHHGHMALATRSLLFAL